MKTNAIDKSVAFAARIINLHKFLVEKNNEQIISRQIIKCGTYIGVYLNAAAAAQTADDRTAQLKSALNENAAADYWIRLLQQTGNIGIDLARSLRDDCGEIKRLIVQELNADI